MLHLATEDKWQVYQNQSLSKSHHQGATWSPSIYFYHSEDNEEYTFLARNKLSNLVSVTRRDCDLLNAKNQMPRQVPFKKYKIH